jgi:FkbM family methyltransferase
MDLGTMIKKRVEKLTNTHIYRIHPRGFDIIHDITTSFPMYRVSVVFDVGANVGQSSIIYLNRFPNSHIYCFEPVNETFRQLQTNLKGNERVTCYRFALGSSRKNGLMVLQGNSDMFFLLDHSKQPFMIEGASTEPIEVVTLDEFCHSKKIDHINYLKIDTEGGDLEVLKGGEKMLTDQRIDFVEVEAGMNPKNKWHVPFEELKKFLELNQYFLFGIYEQVSEWPTRESHLRRTNPVFVSRRMIKKNQQ